MLIHFPLPCYLWSCSQERLLCGSEGILGLWCLLLFCLLATCLGSRSTSSLGWHDSWPKTRAEKLVTCIIWTGDDARASSDMPAQLTLSSCASIWMNYARNVTNLVTTTLIVHRSIRDLLLYISGVLCLGTGPTKCVVPALFVILKTACISLSWVLTFILE